MVDINDPEQLKALMEQYHSSLNPDTPVSTMPDDLAEAARDNQFLAHQAASADKPLGTLGDVVGDKLKAAVPDSSSMPSPQDLAAAPTNQSTSVAQKAITEAGPSVPDEAMKAAVDSSSTGSSFLDNLLAKIPREKINSILGKKLFETEGAESAGLDLLKAGSKTEALKAGAKLAGAGADAAISGAGSAGLKGLSMLGRVAGPLGGAQLASDALEHGDTSPTQRDYQKGVSDAETKELGAEDPDSSGLTISSKPVDLLNLFASGDNTKLTPEEQAKADEFAKNLANAKAHGMLPYQMSKDQDNFANAGIGPNSASIFDRVSGKYQDKQKDAVIGPLAPGSSGGGVPLAKSAPSDTPTRAPAVESPQLQLPSISSQFADAQSAANMGTLTAQLGKAGALIGSGIGAGITRPTEIDNKIFDTNMAVAQQLPEQFKQRLEMSKQDPNSDMSQTARDFIKQSLGINIPDNISAAQLKEQFPVIEKLLAARENAKMRAFMANQNLEMRRFALAQQHEQFMDGLNLRGENLRERTQNAIEKDPIVKTIAQRQMSIQRARQMLASGIPISPELQHDIGREMASGMTGTNAVAQSFVKNVDFTTAASEWAKHAQQLTGNIQDLRQKNPQILKYMDTVLGQMDSGFAADAVTRKADLARSRLSAASDPHAIKGLQVYVDNEKEFLKHHTVPRVGMSGSGASTQSSNAPSAPTAPSSAPTGQSQGNISASTLSQYAQKHGLSEDQAARILKGRGLNVEGY